MKNIFSIIVIAISLAVFVLFVQPQYKDIQDIEAKSEQLEGVLVNARKLQSIRDDLLLKEQSITAADISRLEKLIPENADNVKLILEFQKIADQFDIKLQTASSSKEEEGGETVGQSFDIETKDYGIISMDFAVTGTYGNFVSFLRSIEENLRISDVRQLSIAASADATELDYEYTLSIDTYWLKDNI